MFDLNDYLAMQRGLVDAALDAALPDEAEPPAVLHRAMRYSVFSGGKRLRAVLCLACADAARAADRRREPTDFEAAMPAAVAVELLHTYTLIHDDLPCMDDDDERRGKPTCHIAFGEANALLAGDALQALAFEVLARADTSPLVAELAHAAGSRGVIGGQVEDLALTGAAPTLAQVEFVHEHKTADLFRAACRLGALSAGATPETLDALTRYGRALGLAFQIADDLLDAPESPDGASGGAPVMELSCVPLLGRAGARQRAESAAQSAADRVANWPGAAADALRALSWFAARRTS